MDHIQNQLLEFEAIRRFRLDQLSFRIHIGNFLLHDMEHQLLIHDLLQLVFTEEIIQNDAEIVSGLSVFIGGSQKLRCHLIILYDGRAAVLQAHGTDLLIRSCLAHHLGAAAVALACRGTQENRITDPLQNIVHGEAVQPFNAELVKLVYKTGLMHGAEPSAVSVGRGCDLERTLHIDLAVVIGSRRHILPEEEHKRRIISEIIVLLHEGDRGLVILVAGHDKEREKAAGFLYYIHHVLNQALHDINRMGLADVIHALRIIRAKPCSHSSGQKNRTELTLTNELQSLAAVFRLLFLDL